MQNKTYQARIAALSIAQSSTMVRLLRSYGQNAHAENIEAAINAVTDIVSAELGRHIMAEAMAWVADESWEGDDLPAIATRLH